MLNDQTRVRQGHIADKDLLDDIVQRALCTKCGRRCSTIVTIHNTDGAGRGIGFWVMPDAERRNILALSEGTSGGMCAPGHVQRVGH